MHTKLLRSLVCKEEFVKGYPVIKVSIEFSPKLVLIDFTLFSLVDITLVSITFLVVIVNRFRLLHKSKSQYKTILRRSK